MEHKLIAEKAAISAAITTISAFLGWKGILAVAWVLAMALDYISGSAAACKAREWSSSAARQGLWHKGGMILVVMVSGIADMIMAVVMENMSIGLHWPGVVLPLVLTWYIITELGSILENAVKLGATVPEWLVKLLKISLSTVNSAGDASANTQGMHDSDSLEVKK